MGNFQNTPEEPKRIEVFPFLKNFYRRKPYEFWKIRVPDGFRNLSISHPYPLSYLDPMKVEESLTKIVSSITKRNTISGTVNGLVVSLSEWIFFSCQKKDNKENLDHIINGLIIFRFMMHHIISNAENQDDILKHFEVFPQHMDKQIQGDVIDYFLSSLVTYISERELNTTFYLGIGGDEEEEESSSSSEEDEEGEEEEESSSGEKEGEEEEETEGEEEEEGESDSSDDHEEGSQNEEKIKKEEKQPQPQEEEKEEAQPIPEEEEAQPLPQPQKEEKEKEEEEAQPIPEEEDEEKRVILEKVSTANIIIQKEPEEPEQQSLPKEESFQGKITETSKFINSEVTSLSIDAPHTPLSFYDGDEEVSSNNSSAAPTTETNNLRNLQIREKNLLTSTTIIPAQEQQGQQEQPKPTRIDLKITSSSSGTSEGEEEEEEEGEEEEEEGEENEEEEEEEEEEEDGREHNVFLESLLRIRSEDFVSTFLYNLLRNVSMIAPTQTNISSYGHIFRDPLLATKKGYPEQKQQQEEGEAGIFSMMTSFLVSLPMYAYSAVFGDDPTSAEAYAKLFASRKRYMLAQVSANVLQFLLFYRKKPCSLENKQQEQKGKQEQEQQEENNNQNVFLKSFRKLKEMPYDVMSSLLLTGLSSHKSTSQAGLSSLSSSSGKDQGELGTDEETLYILMYLLLTENEEFVKFVMNHPRPSRYLIPVLEKLYVDTTRKTENLLENIRTAKKTLEIRSNNPAKAKQIIESSNQNINQNKSTPIKTQKQVIQERERIEAQKKPEYTKEYVWLQIIILMILSQHNPFCTGLDRPLPKSEAQALSKWYKEYKFEQGKINGVSCLFMVVIRNIQWSVAKKKEYDNSLNMNALCVCANIAPMASDLHGHAAERLFKIMKLLCKKHKLLKLQKEQQKESKEEEEEDDDDENNLEELLYVCIEIINSILLFRFDTNPSFLYQLLWDWDALKKLINEDIVEGMILMSARPDRLKLEIDNILQCLTSLETFMMMKPTNQEHAPSQQQKQWTVVEIQNILQKASVEWSKNLLGMKKPVSKVTGEETDSSVFMKYQFSEEEEVEDFFTPYIWSMILVHTDIVDWSLEKVQFELPFLGLQGLVDQNQNQNQQSSDDSDSTDDDSSDDTSGSYESTSTEPGVHQKYQKISKNKVIREKDADQAMDYLDSTTTDDEEREIRKKRKRLRRKKRKSENMLMMRQINVGSPILEKNELDDIEKKKDVENEMQV